MSGDENSRRSAVRYETKTVQAVRGTVAKTIANWEAQGWEVVSQSEGLLRTEITLGRAKRGIDVRRYALIGAGAAVVIGAIVAVSILAGGGGDEETTAQQAAGTTSTSTTTTSPAAPPATSSAAPSEETVLTAENNSDLAAVLAVTDYCSPQVATFAQTYQGRTIAFPASVANIANHDGASTRYDILLAPGDEGPNSTVGPAFQFRDVNTTNDLNITGDGPNSITAGTLLDVTAEVDEYDATYGCLFRLQPVQTSFR
ncbi:DUF4839 domain-containing protein [Klenkia sp. PcliD-1-E]|uniref:DUF4839 domain-containing protein n=1 Tax=Klenkia sp. PcliD-1-E TaxID=2954492 RepID=UPI0020971A27|nr:DUF4839 domain-containing protein [Klenkia sp. PcliD-1-E]MCO7219492.1 DUF4839 domain-containing protein [Klenkia sp. PcliD-1-E]